MIALRNARIAEAADAMGLINQAKEHLKAQGIDQWQKGYPDLDCIREDLESQRGYFLVDGSDIIGYLCVDFAGEPAYTSLYGTWKGDGPYGAVHRLAICDAYRGRGIAVTAFELVEELCLQKSIHSIRVDTDENNQKMQHILKKNNFEYCGKIWFDNSEKIAFEKLF